ncbi:putative lipase 1 precursor, partial [Glonium stellatum]
LSYQIPYDSVDLDASPSYSLYTDPLADISNALSQGWYVNVPDYEGPLASMVAGKQAGHATLDSVRAVLSSGLGLTPNARYAMWGYSGGSLASEWAAELQAQYAPELNFSGAAVGGVLVNVFSALKAITGTYFAELIPAGLIGITNQHPEAYEYLVSRLKPTGPYNRTTFLSIKNMSWNQSIGPFANQNIYDYFIGGMADLQAPVLQKIFASDGVMGHHGVPQMPLFVYNAVADEIATIDLTDALVNQFCALGVNILYRRNTVGGHGAEIVNGDASAFKWLSSVLGGTHSMMYSTQGCTIQNVTLNVTSSPL